MTIGVENFGELYNIRQIRQNFLPPKFSHVWYVIKIILICQSFTTFVYTIPINLLYITYCILRMHVICYEITYIRTSRIGSNFKLTSMQCFILG